jgi:KH domain
LELVAATILEQQKQVMLAKSNLDSSENAPREFKITVVRMLVHDLAIGPLLGRFGKNVQRIQEKHSVRLRAAHMVLPQSSERIVEISGEPSQIANSIRDIVFATSVAKSNAPTPDDAYVRYYDPSVRAACSVTSSVDGDSEDGRGYNNASDKSGPNQSYQNQHHKQSSYRNQQPPHKGPESMQQAPRPRQSLPQNIQNQGTMNPSNNSQSQNQVQKSTQDRSNHRSQEHGDRNRHHASSQQNQSINHPHPSASHVNNSSNQQGQKPNPIGSSRRVTGQDSGPNSNSNRQTSIKNEGENNVETETIKIPEEAVGRVIGRRGIRIAKLRKISGCEISISQTAVDGENVVTFSGSAPQIAKAIQEMSEFLNEERPLADSNTNNAGDSGNFEQVLSKNVSGDLNNAANSGSKTASPAGGNPRQKHTGRVASSANA